MTATAMDDYHPKPEWWLVSQGSRETVVTDEKGRRVYDDAEWPRTGINDFADLKAYVEAALAIVEGLRVYGDVNSVIGLEHGKRAVENARSWLFNQEFRGYPAEPPSVNELDRASIESLLRAIIIWIEDEVSKLSTGSGHEPTAEHETNAQPPARAGDSPSSTERREGGGDHEATVLLLGVFTNGLADERLEKAARMLRNVNLTVDEKLTKIHELIPFPPTASADKLGKLVGKTKQAVIKTQWWKDNRKGEKESEIGRRRVTHKGRAKQHERTRTVDGDE